MHLLTHLCALSALLGMLVGCAGAARVVQDATPTTVLSAVMPIDAPPSPAVPTTTSRPRATLTEAERPSPVSPTNTLPPCPVTLPNGSTPPAAPPSPNLHGNDALWVWLWPEGKVLIDAQLVQPDGSLRMKFPWYRGVSGQLVIAGQRLDTPAPPLRAHIPEGYGVTGFQSSVIFFPTASCWEVTGRVGDASLTFVTLVENARFR